MLIEDRAGCPIDHLGHGHLDAPLVNGVRIDPASTARFAAHIESFLRCGHSHVVHFIPADPTVLAIRDGRYRAILNRGDLNVADGMSVVWALRLAGYRTARITGSDAMAMLTAGAATEGARHFLYGGSPLTLQRLEARLRSISPSIHIDGQSPPFREPLEDELRDAAERIRRTNTDLLWIGLGTPKQDVVADRFRELGAAPVILCVGAAFDFLAGTRHRAPVWMQRAGLEWLHRLASEPTRLWRRYLLENPRFVLGVGMDLLRARRQIPGHQPADDPG